MELNEQEVRALDSFISQNQSQWLNAASKFLSEDEIIDLEAKLMKE